MIIAKDIDSNGKNIEGKMEKDFNDERILEQYLIKN